MVVQSQQVNYSSMMKTDKLLWYDYDKPCFYSFKGGEDKEGQKT